MTPRTEPLPLEARIVELLRVQWARAHATQALAGGQAMIEARIVVTPQHIRVEVTTRATRQVDVGEVG
jgi:hypothetical protein